MRNHSKAIGAVVGAVAGYAVSRGLLPAELATPEMVASLTAVFSTVATYLFPQNRTA